MYKDKTIYYIWFQILLTALVALVYFSDTLKRYLLKEVYDFLILHRDFIIGCYYMYLAYEIYNTKINIQVN